ncbi:unnamed protein product [Rhizoctonia solani]|uniref:Uncharacterized protein n=1 Tax=Rhizoctonia solani TaxID=456999 RepID=A0A8H3A9G6_9AGAM|nr:unnamed protein product [Rhizoctonia solani]
MALRAFLRPSLITPTQRLVRVRAYTPILRSAMSSNALSVVATQDAPSAIGPYAQAIKAGGFIFASGCIPLVPSTMQVVEGGIEQQTAQALANLKAVVTASGSDVNKIVKTTVFMKDMNDFVAMNKVYAEFFGEHKPARSAVEVARLPKDVLVEIEFVALAN